MTAALGPPRTPGKPRSLSTGCWPPARAGRPTVVGRRPGKAIDGLFAETAAGVGDDADLAAVVLRLLRKELLGAVDVAYAPRRPDTGRRPVGPAVRDCRGSAGRDRQVDVVPLVRDDVGGVLVGAGYLGPLTGTVYVDEHRVLQGAARRSDQPRPGEGPFGDRQPAAVHRRRSPANHHPRPGGPDRLYPNHRDPGRHCLRAADGPLDLLQTHRAAPTGPIMNHSPGRSLFRCRMRAVRPAGAPNR